MGERPVTTADAAARLADVDVERGEMQRAAPRQPNPISGQVVRELPKQARDATASSILRYSEEHLGELFGALSKAQAEFTEIERKLKANVKSKRTNTEYSYEYASLDEVLQAVRPALSKVGMSFQQFPAIGNGFVTVRSLLGHESGGWMMNDLTLPCDTSGPQEAGSGITFARRYAAMPMLGVAPSSDDDGAAARPKDDPPRPAQRRSETPVDNAAPQAQAQPKPTAERTTVRAKPATTAPQEVRPQETIGNPAASPAANQPVQDDALNLSPVGRIAQMQEKPNGAIWTLETGFRAASKDEDVTKQMKVYRASNATVKLTTRPSSDPSRFAPVIVLIDVVKRVREPGEEG